MKINNLSNRSKWISSIISLVILLLIISAILVFTTSLSFLDSLRISFGSVYVLFLPGFILSFLFFPKKESIDLLERIALSFALSIAVVPLVIFYLNLVGLKINLLNSSLTILGIIILSLVGIWIKKKYSK